MLADIRYAFRCLQRAPLFSASVAATIGLGLGVLCSAFTLVNAYILKPIDLPDPRALYELSWDTAEVRRHRFGLDDVEALRDNAPHFSSLAAGEVATVMQDGTLMSGLLVTGNYFPLLRGRPALGRLLTPADAAAPGARPVVVLSHHTWQTRYGADPAIVGTQVALGRQRFEVVGVTPLHFGLPGEELVAFWAPLTMARAFDVADPWSETTASPLAVIGRLRPGATEAQARAWFDVWLRQRFPAESDSAPVAVRVESRATRIPLTGTTFTLFALIVSAFGLVLLVACANVTNLLLARAIGRQREIAVRLSLGASRWRVARQLAIESLVLAVPASAVGFAITIVLGRAFPALIRATFPEGIAPVDSFLMPLDPDVRVMALLVAAAVTSAVLVTLAPAVRVTSANLVQASKGEAAMDSRRSRLRAGLVAMQIAACSLFLVGATGLIQESRRVANPDTGISYETVADVRVAPELRAAVAARLASDPAVERVATAWEPPLTGPLPPIGVVASETRIERTAGFAVVSPEYFPLFDIRVVRGRVFTTLEADQSAPVVLVSQATARALWPGRDPIGQTLTLTPPRERRPERRPTHTSVRVIGVTEDVVGGALLDGVDETCVYFATGLASPGPMSLLVRGRKDGGSVRAPVAAAINAIKPDAPFQFYSMLTLMGMMAWIFQAFSVAASFLGVVGLLLAFSGTYAVVAFLMTQRTREFGIRMALGATVRNIVSGMMGETLRIALLGLGAGLAVAAGLVRLFSGTIPIIPAFSPGPYLVAAAIVLAATAVAALMPSLRVARIDPSKALRVD